MARARAWVLCGLLGSALGLSPEGASAKPPKRDPPLLFGGPVTKPKIAAPLDPRLPTGAAIAGSAVRPSAVSALCSFSRPVCVHATTRAAEPGLPAALEGLEHAYERAILALGLKAPLADDGAGGSDALDWYIDAQSNDLTVAQGQLLPGRMDAAPSFCRGAALSGALLERQATLCVGEAMAATLDAGESAEVRRAFALELWWITGSKTSLDVQAVDDAQRLPAEAPVLDTLRSGGASERFALLLETLETVRSAAAPGRLSTSLLSAAASRTPPGAAFFNNEPDVFDVLRHSVDEELPRYADLLVDFGLRRALAGDRDDGTRLPTLAFAGAFARPHFDWVIPFSSLPRRVLSGRPLAPLGTELIWLELDDAPLGATIAFRAEWEPPAAFQWRVLLVDRDGRDVRRVDVTFQERAQQADARVLRLDGAKAMIIAGVNLGGVELAYPFDPDFQPFEPRACTVYLVSG